SGPIELAPPLSFWRSTASLPDRSRSLMLDREKSRRQTARQRPHLSRHEARDDQQPRLIQQTVPLIPSEGAMGTAALQGKVHQNRIGAGVSVFIAIVVIVPHMESIMIIAADGEGG
ncbi:MAG: hypothetical protein ACREDU_12245, partial [Methylocella sp.]